MTRPHDGGRLDAMKRTWWIGVGLVGLVGACSDGTPPQHAQQPPPHPYVQPAPGQDRGAAQSPGATPTVAEARATPAATATGGKGLGLPAPPAGTAKPAVPTPATPFDTPATTSTAPTTAKPAPGTTKVPPAATGTPAGPPPGVIDTSNPQGRPTGSPCSMAKECESNICEGKGCGYNAGQCAPTNRRCTRDMVAYCSCSGQTFGASGTCPGRIYRYQGVCKP